MNNETVTIWLNSKNEWCRLCKRCNNVVVYSGENARGRCMYNTEAEGCNKCRYLNWSNRSRQARVIKRTDGLVLGEKRSTTVYLACKPYTIVSEVKTVTCDDCNHSELQRVLIKPDTIRPMCFNCGKAIDK
jgi:hypothetical protein